MDTSVDTHALRYVCMCKSEKNFVDSVLSSALHGFQDKLSWQALRPLGLFAVPYDKVLPKLTF